MKQSDKPIFITQPDLPDLDKVIPYLQQIWNKKWLTNAGEFHQQLEIKLAEYLGVPFLSLFSNGTLALITALQHLNISGEVITTPFTFVATTHALTWNNIKPVFVDIETEFGNIDTSKIEAAITPETSAILAVHVYGNPAKMKEIDRIAKKHNLKVIYDAAHAFGVKQDNVSVLNKGDLSILSFHATKVFNTFEGGAIISTSKEVKHNIDNLKNFGILNEETIVGAGINAKMNEFQAAIGLLQLEEIDYRIKKRGVIAKKYTTELGNIDGITVVKPLNNVISNYAYYPIFIDGTKFLKSRNELHLLLKENNIITRKYFFPLISNINIYKELESSNKENLPTANIMAERVLCLPIYPDLSIDNVDKIISIIKHC